jgi:uncharacterized protein Yka (UPF0111/DUF47 family)
MARAKKEDIFYTLLKDFAERIEDAAVEYVNSIENYPESSADIPQMKVFENKCDEKVKHIMEELYSSFVTPIERSDINDLALAMDDIVDDMNSIASGLDLFNVSEMRKEGPQLAGLALTAVKDLHIMIDHLPDYKKDPLVMEKAIAVGHIEDEGDLVYQSALRRLFLEEPGGRYTVTWTRLFDLMEDLLDACDHTAGVVRSVVMKNA